MGQRSPAVGLRGRVGAAPLNGVCPAGQACQPMVVGGCCGWGSCCCGVPTIERHHGLGRPFCTPGGPRQVCWAPVSAFQQRRGNLGTAWLCAPCFHLETKKRGLLCTWRPQLQSQLLSFLRGSCHPPVAGFCCCCCCFWPVQCICAPYSTAQKRMRPGRGVAGP